MDFNDVIASAGAQRFFRARQKIVAPGFISHITQRAAGKDVFFNEDGDFLAFLSHFKETAERFALEIFAFCLMSNHTHFLLRPQKKNLDQAMRFLFSGYATKFNKKYQRKGHLVGGPYRQALCLDNSYLLAASVYIHLNPVRAGLCENAKDYRWSSSGLYINKDAPSSFVNPNFVLNLLFSEISKAKEAYARILASDGKLEPENVLEHELAIERLTTRLAKFFPGIFRRIAGKKRDAEQNQTNDPDMLELESMLEDYRSGKYQSGPMTRRAVRYLVEQLTARGFRQKEIAERLGVCRKTVYNLKRSE